MQPDDLWWDEARPCPDCSAEWTPTNPRQKRCPECQRAVYRERNRENMRRVRAQRTT